MRNASSSDSMRTLPPGELCTVGTVWAGGAGGDGVCAARISVPAHAATTNKLLKIGLKAARSTLKELRFRGFVAGLNVCRPALPLRGNGLRR